MKKSVAIMIAALLPLASFGAQVTAPSFVNGSFEDPNVPGLTWQYPTSLPGWTAISGLDDFNLHGSALWPSQEGMQHIEFDSPSASLSQTVSGFTVGLTYQLLFGLAGNPDRAAEYAVRAVVRDADQTLESAVYEFDSTGKSHADIGWRDQSLYFTATDSSLTFDFSRADNGPAGWGPEFDNVRVIANAVPEPGTLSLFAVGLFGMFLQAKRREGRALKVVGA